MARFTKEEKESLYWAMAYVTDLIEGRSDAKIEWDKMESNACLSAFFKLRLEVQGY